MILIVGGQNQGRLEYVLEEFGIGEDEVFDCSQNMTDGEIEQKVIYRIDEIVKTIDFDEFLCLHRDGFCDKIIVTTEMGCGLVPIDKTEREMREKVGRANCCLAKMAERVDRVVCGIGQRIK